MSELYAYLFGRLRVEIPGSAPVQISARRGEILLGYLLLHRQRAHPRPKVATFLCPEADEAQARKNLRQTIWQLNNLFPAGAMEADSLLLADADWVQLNPAVTIQVDVERFDDAYRQARAVPGAQLRPEQAVQLREAVHLYAADLLENCHEEWCIIERERFQIIYIMLLDKLMLYYEAQHEYEMAISQGQKILLIDHARERTYRDLMRLHYRLGDRSTALRLFHTCEQALLTELNVAPSPKSLALYETVANGRPLKPAPPEQNRPLPPPMPLPAGSPASHYPLTIHQIDSCLDALLDLRERLLLETQ